MNFEANRGCGKQEWGVHSKAASMHRKHSGPRKIQAQGKELRFGLWRKTGYNPFFLIFSIVPHFSLFLKTH
jgi:hypothetical protein